MRIGAASDAHLTYCTNIHAGETWPEVRSIVARHVVALKQRIAPATSFGIGLRLSARAAEGLAEPAALDDFRGLLGQHDLYVFTINGFPYGDFHDRRVKEDVYRPDWSEPRRLAYSDLLADLLAELLPSGIDGTVSTVPIGFAPRIRAADAEAIAASAVLAHAAHLHRLRERTGKTVGLALEPEPGCRLETTGDAIDYFEQHLYSRAAIARHARTIGTDGSEAEASLRRHLGLCFDTCHAAVQFEDPVESIERIERAGIPILKVQLTAGLRVKPSAEGAISALRSFADDVYLHQVVIRRGEELEHCLDLPDALDALNEPARDDEWRVHFHVPLFLEALSPLAGTQSFVESLLRRHRRHAVSHHFEVETYTWNVLPESHRHDDVISGIERELRWVMERLVA
jgi:sugar phosphate isomerase/epimerase